MKVGTIEVTSDSGDVKLKVLSGSNWGLTFVRSTGDRYFAELQANDIYQGLLDHCRELQREVLDRLARRHDLPGVRRGKLRQALDAVRSIYGL